MWTGVVMAWAELIDWVMTGEKLLRAGERSEAEDEVSRRFSFSLSLEDEELPMLARDTRPFLLLDGVPGVPGVLPPLDGVLLVPGVPGAVARPCALLARDRPCVPAVRFGVPPAGVRGVVPPVRPIRGPEDRRFPKPFCSMSGREAGPTLGLWAAPGTAPTNHGAGPAGWGQGHSRYPTTRLHGVTTHVGFTAFTTSGYLVTVMRVARSALINLAYICLRVRVIS